MNWGSVAHVPARSPSDCQHRKTEAPESNIVGRFNPFCIQDCINLLSTRTLTASRLLFP